jgi:tRNA1(Val) A37 N6-methylase TrmN6
MDAALLAAAVEAKAGERVFEAGCGAGAALLQAARLGPEARFWGLERDEAARALALRNIALNGLEGAVTVLPGDIARPFKALALERFDAVFANPPFYDDPKALRGPSPEKRGAWLADDGLEAWAGFLLSAVRDQGRLILVHRADRLHDLLNALARGAGAFRIRPIQPFHDQPAKRVLVQAKRGGRAPLTLLPPLVMHERREGAVSHTARADAVLRGAAALGWT